MHCTANCMWYTSLSGRPLTFIIFWPDQKNIYILLPKTVLECPGGGGGGGRGGGGGTTVTPTHKLGHIVDSLTAGQLGWSLLLCVASKSYRTRQSLLCVAEPLDRRASQTYRVDIHAEDRAFGCYRVSAAHDPGPEPKVLRIDYGDATRHHGRPTSGREEDLVAKSAPSLWSSHLCILVCSRVSGELHVGASLLPNVSTADGCCGGPK